MSQTITSQNWHEVQINLPGGMYSKIREHMFSSLEREQFGIILAGYCYCQQKVGRKRDHFLRLLGHEYITPRENELDYAHYTGIRITQEFNNRVLKFALTHNLCIIHVHSHPFSLRDVAFSGIDDHSEGEEAAWLGKHFPQVIFGSIVMGQKSITARVWKLAKGRPQPVKVARILGCDFPLTMINCGGDSSLDQLPDSMFDRQIRAFGKEGQQRISTLKVGIVGLGGTGSLMAEGLARLGVRHFVLVDADRVDETNRNRLMGLTETDVQKQRFKVDLAKREIERVNKSKCKVNRIPVNAATAKATSELKTCDLLVSATDNYYSRLFLQTVSQQYLIPLLNLGVIINTFENKITHGYGDAQLFLPGEAQPCLLCAGQINMEAVNRELASNELKRLMTEQGYIQNADVPDPAVRPLNGIAANLALELFHNLICGFTEPALAISYNMLTHCTEKYIYSKDENCRICGQEGVTGLGDTRPLTYYFDSPD